MTELTMAAERRLNLHIAQLARVLRREGRHRSEIETASAGMREQIIDMLSDDDLVDEPRLTAVLDGLEAPQSWASDLEPASRDRIGDLALASALVAVFGMVGAAVIADIGGLDGGAVMSTVGLFGFSTAAILGAMSRRCHAGRAALAITGTAVVLFVFALVLALFDV